MSLITKKEFAAMANVDLKTIHNWLKAGAIIPERTNPLIFDIERPCIKNKIKKEALPPEESG